ncbi:glutathione S-transferase N-terminal domain-containing protein [Aliivibrio sp. S3MY1]|uniref:glutaredoxin family protein n=1 Tax=unclassified Aliivibrio TaxID=2645654 RepID=UPI002378FB3E|nr:MULTISPECIES: glutathione S-transferase N-terminal domain-containing protein [unclassified Aliivibrio]MDD9195070.1 glutathione S-transferase N-terminal domain-containing protein [Aliivibrio sp. S3MY1]MDD9198360.1 glutathione S-transferase N-terminal domain-containing protein [Aliivibrio sp. S2MY1]
MKLIRFALGKVILGLNCVFSPSGVKRDPVKQIEIDAETANYSLYQFEACPFCVKVRRTIKRQSLKIELRDAKNNEVHKAELLAGGGRVKVPCLRIDKDGETTWMYESSDIMAFLEEKYP